MKLDIKSFMIGLFVFVLFAFTSQEVLTYKPAQPKNIIVLETLGRKEIKTYINYYTKEGYIIKICDLGHGNGGLLIMEKY